MPRPIECSRRNDRTCNAAPVSPTKTCGLLDILVTVVHVVVADVGGGHVMIEPLLTSLTSRDDHSPSHPVHTPLGHRAVVHVPVRRPGCVACVSCFVTGVAQCGSVERCAGAPGVCGGKGRGQGRRGGGVEGGWYGKCDEVV